MPIKPPPEMTMEESLETLDEKQAVFIVGTLVAAGHVSRSLLDDAVRLARWVKP